MSTPVNGWRSRWAGPPGAIRGTDTGRFLRETRRADPGTRRSDEQHGTASSASRRGGEGGCPEACRGGYKRAQPHRACFTRRVNGQLVRGHLLLELSLLVTATQARGNCPCWESGVIGP